MLCRRHHRLVHEQGYEVINHKAGPQRGQIEFRRPDSEVLPEALYPQFAKHRAEEENLVIERQQQRTGLNIDEFTAITRWQGGAHGLCNVDGRGDGCG